MGERDYLWERERGRGEHSDQAFNFIMLLNIRTMYNIMMLLYLEKETTIFTFFHVDFCLREINPNSNKLFKWGVFYHAR